MELTRKTLAEIMASNPQPNLTILNATTDEDIEAQQKEDGFDYEFTGKMRVVRNSKTALIAAE